MTASVRPRWQRAHAGAQSCCCLRQACKRARRSIRRRRSGSKGCWRASVRLFRSTSARGSNEQPPPPSAPSDAAGLEAWVLEASLAEEGLAGSCERERQSPYCKGPPHAVHGATSGGTRPPAAALCCTAQAVHAGRPLLEAPIHHTGRAVIPPPLTAAVAGPRRPALLSSC